MKGVYEEMRKSVQLNCLTDSSAAKGITARKGVGKVKHLSLRKLWLQDAVQEKRLKVYKVHTEVNWADLGTRILDPRWYQDSATVAGASTETWSNHCSNDDSSKLSTRREG